MAGCSGLKLVTSANKVEGEGEGKGKERKGRRKGNGIAFTPLSLNSLFILLAEERERGSEDYDFASSFPLGFLINLEILSF